MSILAAPLNDLAWFATEDGSEGVIKWADAGWDLLEPLLDWSDPDTVYRTWGKVVAALGPAWVAGFFALRARRAGEATGVERWGLRIGAVGYPLLALGVVAEYWGPESWLDPSFLFLSLPGLLITMVGSTLLGIGLVRRGPVPGLSAWILALAIPLTLGTTALTGHLSSGAIPLSIAWISVGVWLFRTPGHPQQQV